MQKEPVVGLRWGGAIGTCNRKIKNYNALLI